MARIEGLDVRFASSSEVGVWLGKPRAVYWFSLATGRGAGNGMANYQLAPEDWEACRAWQEQNGGVVPKRGPRKAPAPREHSVPKEDPRQLTFGELEGIRK